VFKRCLFGIINLAVRHLNKSLHFFVQFMMKRKGRQINTVQHRGREDEKCLTEYKNGSRNVFFFYLFIHIGAELNWVRYAIMVITRGSVFLFYYYFRYQNKFQFYLLLFLLSLFAKSKERFNFIFVSLFEAIK